MSLHVTILDAQVSFRAGKCEVRGDVGDIQRLTSTARDRHPSSTWLALFPASTVRRIVVDRDASISCRANLILYRSVSNRNLARCLCGLEASRGGRPTFVQNAEPAE